MYVMLLIIYTFVKAVMRSNIPLMLSVICFSSMRFAGHCNQHYEKTYVDMFVDTSVDTFVDTFVDISSMQCVVTFSNTFLPEYREIA